MASHSVQQQPPPTLHNEAAKHPNPTPANAGQASTSSSATATATATASAAKGKKPIKTAKKTPDANETGKLLAAKINQLELNAADEKDQEQEIGMLFSPYLMGGRRMNSFRAMRACMG